MADDFSWVAPATNSLANLFGLNPVAKAKGRNLQSENDLLLAKTRNTDADTALSPYRQKVYEGQANNYNAGANSHNAQAGKYKAETEGIGITNGARRSLAEAFKAGALVPNEDGSITISPQSVNAVGGALAAMDDNPKVTMEAIRGLQGNAAQTPRAAAQTRGIAAIFRPDSSTSVTEGQQIEAAKAAAAQNTAVEAAKARGIAAGANGAKTGQPNQTDLNRQSEAIQLGADWAMKVPWNGAFLNEEQAYQLSQAARAANPSLNPQDAIVKFVQDNPRMLKNDGRPWYKLGFIGNENVAIKGGVPVTVPQAGIAGNFAKPTAPQAPAAPVAPANNIPPLIARPPAQAPAAPAQPAAPAAGQGLTKQDVLAMPDGSVLNYNGQQYRKQGGQLVKVK